MTKFSTQRRWYCALAAGAFVVLLAWADSANAGCGDYVIYRSHEAGMPLASALLPAGGDQRLPDQLSPNHRPCQGPLCHGSEPVSPVPVPPVPEQIDQRPLALLAAGTDVANPYLAGGGWPRLAKSPLDGFGQSLLRPPCA